MNRIIIVLVLLLALPVLALGTGIPQPWRIAGAAASGPRA